MFDVIRKHDYWRALDHAPTFNKLGGFTLKALDGLKHIQDAWTLYQLHETRNSKVLEVGGGLSRVLPALDNGNERWNLDEFKGAGNGVTEYPEVPGIKLLRKTMGSFAEELRPNYFDIIFSISVIEHISIPDLEPFWKDHARVLAHGGTAFHTIDLYLSDKHNASTGARLRNYLDIPAKYGLRPISEPRFVNDTSFQCDMASNSDWGMWRWNKAVPALYEVRRTSQSVSLAMIVRKD